MARNNDPDYADVVDDVEPPQSNTLDELDASLSEYTRNIEPETDTGPDNEENPNQTDNTESSQAGPAPFSTWHGNPMYFQRGAKKGTKKPNYTPKETMEISGSLIDGALFLMLIDLVIPLLITMLNNNFATTQIKVEDLQMTEKQKRDLTPVADQAARYLTLKMNPVWLLCICMAGIYGLNFMAAKLTAKKNA